MISSNIINEFNEFLKSHFMSDLQALSELASACFQSWAQYTENLEVLTALSSLAYDSDSGSEQIEDAVIAKIIDLYNSSKEIVYNISDTVVNHITVSLSNGIYSILLNGNLIATLQDGLLSSVEGVSKAIYYGLRAIATNLANTAGFYYAVGDICSQASSADWTSANNIATSLFNLVRSYAQVLGSTITDIIKAIGSGPRALLQLLSGILNEAKQHIVDDVDLSYLLSSTSIVYNHFAWGVAAEAIGSITSAIGVAIMAFSRIAGFIAAGVGLLVQTVTRVVVSATTAYDETQYKIKSGSDVVHCFNFVCSRGTTSSQGISSYMRERGWATMTVFCPHQALVYMMYLNNFGDINNYDITFETHLSCDIDITRRLTNIEIGQTHFFVPCVLLENINGSESKPCYLGFRNSYTHSSGDFMLPFWIGAGYGSGGSTTAKPAIALRETAGDSAIWAPVDFTLADSFSQWQKDAFKNYLDVRLCSSLIVYSAYKLSSLINGSYSNIIDDDYGGLITAISASSYNVYSSSVVSKFVSLYSLAWRCFANSSSVGTDSIIKSTFGLTDSDRSDLLDQIVSCFDGLAYQNSVQAADLGVHIYSFTDDGNGTMVITLKSSGTSNNFTISKHQTFVNPVTSFNSMEGYWPSINQLGLSYFSIWAAGVWNKNTSVTLPTLSFQGFILGLIVDGLIVAATITVAVLATVGWIKLRNTRSQLQAKAEKAWYDYEDNGQTDGDWKAFKKARLKYNLLALATGGTALSMGLYDDGSTAGDVISAISGVVGQETTSEFSLRDIYALIKPID